MKFREKIWKIFSLFYGMSRVKILQTESATGERARATKLDGPFQGPSSYPRFYRWSLIKTGDRKNG